MVSALAIFEVTETERPVCRLGNRGRPELPSNSIHTGFLIKIRGNTHFPMSDLYKLSNGGSDVEVCHKKLD